MQQRIELLNGCFEWLEKAALKQLKEKQISVEDLCLKVTSLKCLRNDNSINFFVVNQMECLFKSSSVVIVFGFLNTYWSYLSYHLLEHVINQCSLEGLKIQMKEFKAEVNVFKEETPLGVFAEVEKKLDLKIPDGFEVLISNHKFSKGSFLKEVERARVELNDTYRFEDFVLMVNDILSGSIKIVWLIPTSATQHVLQVTSTTERGRFRTIMLVELNFQGECIYKDDLTSEVHDQTVQCMHASQSWKHNFVVVLTIISFNQCPGTTKTTIICHTIF